MCPPTIRARRPLGDDRPPRPPHLTESYALAGRPAEAIPLLERAVEIEGVLSAPILVFLGQAYLVGDRTADAQRVAGRALALALERKERGWEAWGRWLLAEAGGPSPSSGSSQEAYGEALVLAETLGMRPLIAHCHRGPGRVYRRMGNPQAAGEHRTRAIGMYGEMEMMYAVDPPDASAWPRGRASG